MSLIGEISSERCCRAAAKGTGAIGTVGTAGVRDVFPGAVNGVPSRCRVEADIRDIDAARRDSVLAAVREQAERIASYARSAMPFKPPACP